jgi:hypothetical protein
VILRTFKGKKSYYRCAQVHGRIGELIGDIDFEYIILRVKVSESRR